jgi:hypothetical protein
MEDITNLIEEPQSVRFTRNETGRLLLHRGDEKTEIGLTVGAFPLSNPGTMICLKDLDGNEIAILKDMNKLEASSKELLKEELDRCYFMPRIVDILDTTEKLNIVNMDIKTNRGFRTIQIKNIRNSIRKLGKGRIIIRDLDGNRYEIRKVDELSEAAQDMLDVYL